MKNPDDPNAIKADVLQAPAHTQLSSEEIAKAVARHKREHPAKPESAGKPNKKRSK
jgi:hypothetical protein